MANTNNYQKYIKYKSKYLKLKQSLLANQKGGGVNFDIIMCSGICVNKNIISLDQKKFLKKIIDLFDINDDYSDYLIDDPYDNDNAWLMLCTSANEIDRNWDRFPNALSSMSKNKDFWASIDIDPVCIRLDGTNEDDEDDGSLLSEKNITDFLDRYGKSKMKNLDEQLKLFNKFFTERKGMMFGKWLILRNN